MTISSYGTGAYRAARTNEFVSTRGQLDDLQRQLSTQKRSETYGDLGIDRRTSLDLNAKVSSLDAWLAGIELADVNLKIATQAVTNFQKLTNETKNDVRSNSYVPSASERSAPQILAEEKFKQTLDLLNSDVNGRYFFSGRTSDIEPVAGYDEIMNGDGAGRAGLRDVIKERKIADGVSATATGRLTTTLAAAPPNTVSVARDANFNDVYGFRFGDPAATTTSTGLVVTATPTLAAATSIAVEVDAQPLPGDTLTFKLTLPDGTTEAVVLTARAAGTTGDPAASFVIGADEAETADNLRETIGKALEQEARTSLEAASATVAAKAFFAGSTNSPPVRVNPSDYTQAPAVDPTGTVRTVIWYKGDDALETVSPARSTGTVQIGSGQTVAVGARANEEAFQIGLASFAALAAERFPVSDANSRARYDALTERTRENLGFGDGAQSPVEIITEFGTAQNAMAQAKERNQATKNTFVSAVSEVENVSTEEVAVQILALQTRLQASYQVTSILSKLSLTNYL